MFTIEKVKAIQKDMYQWKFHNFGGLIKNGHQNMLGIIEEVGELSHSILKQQQQIRLKPGKTYEDMMKDAIGDIFIFLMNYLSERKIEFIFPMTFNDISACDTTDEVNVLKLFRLTSDIVGSQLLIEIEGFDERYNPILVHQARQIVSQLVYICDSHQWDFEEVILSTWNTVKKRDWKNNTMDGVSK